jgi:hypothetical protein
MLAPHRAGSLALQSFVADWGAGRVGVAWSDPMAPPEPTTRSLRRALVGAGLGVAVAAVVLVFAGITRAATFSHGNVAPSALGLGLVVALFGAVRDELVLRGVVLRAFRHTLALPMRIVVCGLVGAADQVAAMNDQPLGELVRTPASLVSVASAAFLAVGFALLWLRERGAFAACGAHAAWTWVTTTLVAGGLVDGVWSRDAWGGGDLLGSLATATVLGALAALAFVRLRPRASGGEGGSIGG